MRIIAVLIVVLAANVSDASAAVSVFPTSVFQASGGTNANNLIGNTPQSARLNRGQTIVLGFGTTITGFDLTLNITTVTANTTYVWVRFGRINGGAFTNANGSGLFAPNGAATGNFYALIASAGQLIIPAAPFVSACNGIGGCNAIVFGNSAFSANGSQFRLNTLVASNPEPSAWMLMIAGFFGVAMRLKRLRRERSAPLRSGCSDVKDFATA